MVELFVHVVCIVLGLIFAVLGIVGVIVPVLPTTPFLLLAGFFFARSSRRMDHWLKSTKAWNAYVQPFIEKQSIPSATKARILIVSGVVMGFSAFAVRDIEGINFVVWFSLELVMLWLLYLMFVRIPTSGK